MIATSTSTSLPEDLRHRLKLCLLQQYRQLNDVDRIHPIKFFKLQFKGQMFFAQQYRRVKKRNSYTVLYTRSTQKHFGKILYFLLVQQKPVAVLQRYHILDGGAKKHFSLSIQIQGIVPVKESTEIDIIAVEKIVGKYVFVEIDCHTKYIAVFPSSILSD